MSEGHLLIVAYHYVLDGAGPLSRGLKGVSVEEFTRQLDVIGDRYAFVDPTNLSASPRGDGRPRCLLTFDDGTRDHLQAVAPILNARGVRGLFFAVIGVLLGEVVLTVHLLHQLLARCSPRQIVRAIEEVGAHAGVRASLDLTRPQTYYRYDDPETAALKFQLNHAIAPEIADLLVRGAFEALVMPVDQFCREFYLTLYDVRALESMGHIAAAHSYSHRNLARMTARELDEDVARAAAGVERLGLALGARHFALPFGGPGTFDAPVLEALRSRGFEHIYTGLGRLNGHAGPLLHRYGVHELPPFKSRWPEPAGEFAESGTRNVTP